MPAKKKDSNELVNFFELDAMKKYLIQSPFNEQTQMKLNTHSLLVGSTGSGKTHCLMNYLLKSPNFFQLIIVLYKITDPLYEYMRDNMRNGTLVFYTNPSQVPSLLDLRKEFNLEEDDQILLIVDDYISELGNPKYNFKDIYTYGRKVLTSLNLVQSYFETPIFIRNNIHYLILVKINDNRELKAIIKKYTMSISDKLLLRIYEDATKKKLNFLKIDITNTDNNKKFSRNFTDFYQIEDVN